MENLAFRAGGCAVLGEIEQPTISDEPEGLSAAASNFHPTLGYAPPQPHLGILLGGLRASAAALLQVGAWIRMRSQFATSAVQGLRARSEEPHL